MCTTKRYPQTSNPVIGHHLGRKSRRDGTGDIFLHTPKGNMDKHYGNYVWYFTECERFEKSKTTRFRYDNQRGMGTTVRVWVCMCVCEPLANSVPIFPVCTLFGHFLGRWQRWKLHAMLGVPLLCAFIWCCSTISTWRGLCHGLGLGINLSILFFFSLLMLVGLLFRWNWLFFIQAVNNPNVC